MFQIIGKLCYFPEESKINIAIDRELTSYYLHLIPKYYKVKPGRYPPHLTVVRNELLKIREFDFKSEYEIKYDNTIYNNSIYYWLRAYCPELNELRKFLDLPEWSPWCMAPDLYPAFHITIGNTK